MRTLILVALLAAGPARAAVGCIGSDADECRWTAADYALEGATLGALALDYSFTMDQGPVRHLWPETNPILGQYPTPGEIRRYFGGVAVLHAAVAYALPKPWRTAWQAVWIGTEGYAITRNVQCGIHLSF